MFTIRHFNPIDEEYEAAVAVHNAEWPDNLSVVSNWKHHDKHRNPKHLYQRYVGEIDDKIVMVGSYMETHWTTTPDQYSYGYDLHPDYADFMQGGKSIPTVIYEYVLQSLADRNPVSLGTGAREDKTDRVQWLNENGFEFQMRYPVSELDVPAFDPSPFRGIQEKIALQGIEIIPLSQLQKHDPDWKQKTYDMCWELEKDVPSPDPIQQEPMEEWEKTFINPSFLAEGWFIAVDNGEYVGVSMLGLDQAQPEKMHTWLTGVARSHRRSGLATAMKLRAIEFAQSRGAKRIDTDNEESNPMYKLNMMLGFKPKPAWADYTKKL